MKANPAKNHSFSAPNLSPSPIEKEDFICDLNSF